MTLVVADRRDTPLCPLQGHLPRKEGEGNVLQSLRHKYAIGARHRFTGNHWRMMVSSCENTTLRRAPLSPLAGEMSALADRGGYTAPVAITEHGARQLPHRKVSNRLRQNARKLRSDMTDAEKKLWQALRAHRLEGIAFRRQMPIEGYIVDFAAPACRLIVELDGSQHAEDAGLQRDSKRDAALKAFGWTVLRFWNSEVLTDLDGV